jgi:hypothetical protein
METAARYRAKAKELREKAKSMLDEEARKTFMDLATEYDRLAVQSEQISRRQSNSN